MIGEPQSMNKGLLLIAAVLLAVSAAYGLNRGIFVGSERLLYGPEHGNIMKTECHYLFITGISKFDAGFGENSYCRFFALPS
jgi:hypothetical protein